MSIRIKTLKWIAITSARMAVNASSRRSAKRAAKQFKDGSRCDLAKAYAINKKDQAIRNREIPEILERWLG